MDVLHRPGPECPRYLVGFDLRRRPHLDADVLVVGAGLAGLAAALAAADAGAEVLLLTKSPVEESNTAYAQGGIAAVLDEERRRPDDSIDQHVIDTLAAGAGLCDETAVRDILAAVGEGIDLLTAHDCQFDRNPAGALSLTREGGHRHERILHASGDATGREISRALAAAVYGHPNIEVVRHAFAIDLLTDDDTGRVRGVLYSRRGEIFAALAGATVLACGGTGQVFRETTNPAIATGDGLAMAYRAGAELSDLEFVQFHPTTLYIAGGGRMLVTEAMRGEGAVLKNQAGERFMPAYHPDAELAPRDVVSRAIVSEISQSGFSHVWLDASHLGADFLRQRFPNIHAACARFDIDLSSDWIPVHPSAHYHCGGVRTDTYGTTSLPGLLACGEVACTGLHGANRLASNSLAEALVVGRRAGARAAEIGGEPGRVRLSHERRKPAPEALDVADLTRSVRAMTWRHVGLERNAAGLATARRSLEFWTQHQARGFFPDEAGWTLQNLLLVGCLITSAAEQRAGSVGTHSRADDSGDIDRRHITMRRVEQSQEVPT